MTDTQFNKDEQLNVIDNQVDNLSDEDSNHTHHVKEMKSEVKNDLDSKEKTTISKLTSVEDILNVDVFDDFILQNFTPFSEKTDVVQWFDETEDKFKQFRMGTNARYKAISFLTTGDGKRKYVKHRKEIQSFDDFYEFLLAELDSLSDATYTTKRSHSVTFLTDNLKNSTRIEPELIPKPSTANNDISTVSFQRSIANDSTAMVHRDIANSFNGRPSVLSTTSSSHSSTMDLDQNLNDLRRAIVQDLIKNPKVFKGGKDNVKNG
ncbi:unnamed protein product [Adineta ricciae]|uniref:Uncharacterized protein n=1 Tax=Adineta ricciae TaxID=249248 RepID=A0A815T8L6_ADIRI|nr:unnamed protein product [Adineta ricciae]CAF1636341.1 unnamed protein product [Adineta ricciae]